MVKDLVIDLFHGEYHGAWKGTKDTDRGKKPVIKPMAYGVPAPTAAMKRSKVFPFPLDMQENVKRLEVSGGPSIRLLIPTADVPGVDVDDTLWGQLETGREEELQRVKDERDSLKTQKRQLEKKVDRLEEEKDDVQDRGSTRGGQNTVVCPMCESGFDRAEWKQNNGYCPSCDSLHPQYDGGRV